MDTKIPTPEELLRFVTESNLIEGAPTDPSDPWFRRHWGACYYVIGASILRDMWPPLVLHEILFSSLMGDAGTLRTVPVRVGQDICPPPQELPQLLTCWHNQLQSQFKHMDEEKAWYYHHAFECIHPFRDGNGRVGRLVLNSLRLMAGLPWLTIMNHRKYTYYSTIRQFRYEQWPALYEGWRNRDPPI